MTTSWSLKKDRYIILGINPTLLISFDNGIAPSFITISTHTGFMLVHIFSTKKEEEILLFPILFIYIYIWSKNVKNKKMVACVKQQLTKYHEDLGF